jgi:hypothetical protein
LQRDGGFAAREGELPVRTALVVHLRGEAEDVAIEAEHDRKVVDDEANLSELHALVVTERAETAGLGAAATRRYRRSRNLVRVTEENGRRRRLEAKSPAVAARGPNAARPCIIGALAASI